MIIFKLLSSEDAIITTLIFQKSILAQYFTTSLKISIKLHQIVSICLLPSLEGVRITEPVRDIAIATIVLNVWT